MLVVVTQRAPRDRRHDVTAGTAAGLLAAQARDLEQVAGQAFDVFDIALLGYFLAINTGYLLLVLFAAVDFAGHLRRSPTAGYEQMYASPMTRPVSLVVAAFDEELSIVESVRAMLDTRYPQLEVIVCDDGSTDGTFARLQAAFGLVEFPRVVPADVPVRGQLLSVHVPADGVTPLVVARKVNGGRADANNVGVNLAQYPLVAICDADSILDSEALLTVAKPFADDPLRVVATGGVVRVVNGCTVAGGRVSGVRMPRRWLPRVQVVEYLRSFLLGRSGWSWLGALALISGAFGLYRRDVVVAVGGFDPDCIGEDYELVVAIHRRMREQQTDYRIVFVSEPVSWTEVPASTAVLARQRRRWHRGLYQVLRKHRRMLFNPRYGRIGLLALPFYLVFELLAPVVELAGLLLLPVGVALDLVDLATAGLVLLVAYGYAVVVSLAALTVEEFSFHRYPRWTDLAVGLAAAVVENLGYRQLTLWWRLQGLWAELRGRPQVWGRMTRAGFDPAALPARRP